VERSEEAGRDSHAIRYALQKSKEKKRKRKRQRMGRKKGSEKCMIPAKMLRHFISAGKKEKFGLPDRDFPRSNVARRCAKLSVGMRY